MGRFRSSAIGPQGPAGPQGDQGWPGEAGAKGDKGETGEAGTKGDQGPAGDAGAKGDQGDQGWPGEAGEAGPQGDVGPQGDQGEKGDPGDAGAKGDAGPQGIQGDPGAKGDQGDVGPQGSKGDKGDPGAAGADGSDANILTWDPMAYKTTDYALLNTDLYVGAQGSGLTMTLPTTATPTGKVFTIKNVSSTYSLAVTAESGTVGGYTTVSLPPGAVESYIFDSSNYQQYSASKPASLGLVSAPAVTQQYSGTVAYFTYGESLVPGDVVYVKSDGAVWKADADAAGLYPAVGIAVETASSGLHAVLLHGIYRDDTLYNWTVGGVLYLSTTAGALTQTQPSATDNVIQIVGVATHADRAFIRPDLSWITHT